ncbi:cupin domain-containing protein [Sphingomonas quercus]|uniref:DUF861 domain-containing protein n=1 Tax=Sphingomonas quercus TaxID=2842451 RepID=A0ABS6BHY7_9SPHN|nr:cupin domain-containing protein [Sphingomonas quercus]MBU3077925.1 DUF861 domain-containing protein [Sphingomonas quercus]
MRSILATGLLLSASSLIAQQPVVHPIKIARAEAGGAVFARPQTITKDNKGKRTRDLVAMMSTDKKFESGMYEAGPSHFEVKDRNYGVDEFMLFVKGSVTLTSLDGTKTVLGPGDAVTLPAEWRGTWDTPGYTKYYVIYSREGKLE